MLNWMSYRNFITKWQTLLHKFKHRPGGFRGIKNFAIMKTKKEMIAQILSADKTQNREELEKRSKFMVESTYNSVIAKISKRGTTGGLRK